MEQNISRQTKKPALCFCRSLRPLMLCLKLLGILPITAIHRNNECVFVVSKMWTMWSIAVLCCLIFHMIVYTEVLELLKKEKTFAPLHSILLNVVSTIYCIYAIALLSLTIVRKQKFVIAMNKVSSFMKEGLLCQSALQLILRLQYGHMVIGFLCMVTQLSVLIYLHTSEAYHTDFDYKVFLNEALQIATMLFCIMFFTWCAVFMGMLACLEKMIISIFNVESTQPSQNIYKANNEIDFMGISWTLCKSDHVNRGLLRKFEKHEIIDYLRCLHEQISGLICEFNECINLQILFYMVVELVALIVNYYAVICYFVYEFPTTISSAIHFLNCYFVVLHTLGVFIFLKNAQQLQNMVKGLIPILLEYSTRVTVPEEHQQIRLFVEKLKQCRPINASGIVNVDLSIAGPICANILTYVLVALQFGVPKH